MITAGQDAPGKKQITKKPSFHISRYLHKICDLCQNSQKIQMTQYWSSQFSHFAVSLQHVWSQMKYNLYSVCAYSWSTQKHMQSLITRLVNYCGETCPNISFKQQQPPLYLHKCLPLIMVNNYAGVIWIFAVYFLVHFCWEPHHKIGETESLKKTFMWCTCIVLLMWAAFATQTWWYGSSSSSASLHMYKPSQPCHSFFLSKPLHLSCPYDMLIYNPVRPGHPQ